MAPLVHAVAHFKGGVGKTTTAVTVAWEMAARGHRVLLVDWDPQANATAALGVDRWETGVYRAQDLVNGRGRVRGGDRAGESGSVSQSASAPDQPFAPTPIAPNLDLLPSNPGLQELEYALGAESILTLRYALEQKAKHYDQVWIDTGPSMGRLLFNALCAADHVIVPCRLEVISLTGLGDLLRMIRRAQSQRPAVNLLGLLCLDRGQGNAYREREMSLRQKFGPLVFETVIPRRVALADAFTHNQPVTHTAPDSDGATAYRDFTTEVLARVQAQQAQEAPVRPARRHQRP